MAAEQDDAAPRPCPLGPLLAHDRSRQLLCQAMGAQPAAGQELDLLSAWWLLVHDPGIPVSPTVIEKLMALSNVARPKFWLALGQNYVESVVEGDARARAGINRTAGGILAALHALALDQHISSPTEVNAYWDIDGPAGPPQAKRRRHEAAQDEEREDEQAQSNSKGQAPPAWREAIAPDAAAFAAGDAVMPASLVLLSGVSLYHRFYQPLHLYLYHLDHLNHPHPPFTAISPALPSAGARPCSPTHSI